MTYGSLLVKTITLQPIPTSLRCW